jgi:CheY-like chemotaxis protein
LVIEQDPEVRSSIRRVLGSEHHLTCMKSPIEALLLFEAGVSFDLILCELTHGEAGGLELQLLRSSAGRRIEKPFDPAGLRHFARTALTELGLVEGRGARP